MLIFASAIISLIFFSVLLSISLNVYFHELGHFIVADFYNLNPEMYINNVINIEDNFIRVNMEPVAYVQYQNPGNTAEAIRKNIKITFAGPLANIIISIIFIISYVLIRLLVMKTLKRSIRQKLSRVGSYDSVSKSLKARYTSRVLRICFFIDVIFISLIVPSLISVIVNLSNIPGSDGAFLRELIRQL